MTREDNITHIFCGLIAAGMVGRSMEVKDTADAIAIHLEQLEQIQKLLQPAPGKVSVQPLLR